MQIKAALFLTLAVADATVNTSVKDEKPELYGYDLAAVSPSSVEKLKQWIQQHRRQWTAENQLTEMRTDETNVHNSYQKLAGLTYQQTKAEGDLEEAKTKLEYMKYLRSQQPLIRGQVEIVNTIQRRKVTTINEVAVQTGKTNQLVVKLETNSRCYRNLKDLDESLQTYYDEWQRTPAASDGQYWKATRVLAYAAHNLSKAQEDCAQGQVVQITVFPRPQSCESDTGGSCAVLPCKESRNAQCTENKICACRPGFCSTAGACVQSDHPFELLAHGKSVRAGVNGDALALAGLAALMIVVAVAARQGCGAAREVQLVDNVLG